MSSTINTTAGLRTAIVDAMGNRADVLAQVDDFIVLAEAEFNRVLRLPGMVTTNVAFAASARFTDLPTGFEEMLRVQRYEGGERKRIDFIGDEYAPKIDRGIGGTPRYWDVIGLKLELMPAPSAAMTLDISYWADLTTITAGTANFLLTSHPDLYLYRSIIAAAQRMQDDKRLKRYSDLYSQVLGEVQKAGKKQRYGRAMAVRAA